MRWLALAIFFAGCSQAPASATDLGNPVGDGTPDLAAGGSGGTSGGSGGTTGSTGGTTGSTGGTTGSGGGTTGTTGGTTGSSGGGDLGLPPPSAGDGWQWLNPRPTGEALSAVWSDGTRAWAVGTRGAAIYSDDGSSWHASFSGTAVTLNGVWGAGTSVWAAGAGGTLLHSTDGGLNYQPVGASTTSDLYAVWGTGDTVFVVGDQGVVLRIDSGVVKSLPVIPQVGLRAVWGRSASDVWTAGSYNVVYHSTDGNSFSGTGFIKTSPVAGISGDANNVYVVGNGGWGGFAHFDGTKWIDRDIDPGVADNLYGVWAAAPDDIFAVGDRGTLDQSSNDFVTHGGVFKADIPWQLTAVWGQGDQLYVVGGSGGLFHSVDHAKHFTSGTLGPHAWSTDNHRAIWGLDEQHLFVAGDAGHVWRSVDAGDSWSSLTTNITGALNAVVGRSDGTVVASGGSYAVYSVLIRSHDFGDHWSQAATSPLTRALFLDGDNLYAVEDSRCNVWKTTDWGDHWTSTTVDPSCTSVDQIWAGGMNLVAASTNQPTWYSTDGGAHWSKATMPQGTSITALWGSSASNLWGVGLSGSVLFSSDGGKSWSAKTAGTTDHMQGVTGRGPNDVFVAAGNHVLRTEDGGQTWQSLPDAPYLDAMWPSATHLYGAGTGGAILRITR